MGRRTLITGGCRSGKSRHALELAESVIGDKIFVATAEALDDEMKDRIDRHRRQRGPQWQTVEAPLELVAALQTLESRNGVLVLDCLTLWISNLMAAGKDREFILDEAGRLVDQAGRMHCDVIIITNEVGWGIVPENGLARAFRDMAGEVNQLCAVACDQVILMASGLPLQLKP